MKFEKPANENYCATVVKLKAVVPLENCDNVVGTPIFGFQAIVSKDHKPGDIGIVFPAETQLSEDFCRMNNLYRHGNLNDDESKKGYIEDNRRVKAVKFRGHQSNALFMELDSLKYLGINVEKLNEGDEFDTIDGKEICKKYVIRTYEKKNRQALPKRFKRVDTLHIPEHLDSDNYFRNSDSIKEDTSVIVTQKLHGTSIRIANTYAKRKLNIPELILSKLGVKIKEYEHDYIYGSRKVIKDINNPYQNHFYDTDIWTEEGEKLKGLLPENYIVYGELVGWTRNSAPIQKDYTYKLPVGTCELYIYRVAIVNEQGIVTDLAWHQVQEFCQKNGLNAVAEIWRGTHKDLVISKFLDIRLNDTYKNCLPLDEGFVDEGVCVRVDRITPYILKAKSPIFLNHESQMLDEGVADLETEGSINEEDSIS